MKPPFMIYANFKSVLVLENKGKQNPTIVIIACSKKVNIAAMR